MAIWSDKFLVRRNSLFEAEVFCYFILLTCFFPSKIRPSLHEDALSRFRFTAKEEKTGGIGRCPPRNVSLYLKSGSLPFVRPDGSKVAAKLMEMNKRRRHYGLEMQSNGDQYVIKIEAPPAGDWYAIAFRSWTNPDTGKIRQQGGRLSLLPYIFLQRVEFIILFACTFPSTSLKE